MFLFLYYMKPLISIDWTSFSFKSIKEYKASSNFIKRDYGTKIFEEVFDYKDKDTGNMRCFNCGFKVKANDMSKNIQALDKAIVKISKGSIQPYKTVEDRKKEKPLTKAYIYKAIAVVHIRKNIYVGNLWLTMRQSY